MSLLKCLLECRADPPVSILPVNMADRNNVTTLVPSSPDGKGVAKITGDYTRYPGRTCRYDNGVEGECLLEHKCSKEEKEVSGYNSTWKCPKHMDMYRNYRICCPFLGKENLQEGEGKTLSNSKKLC